MTRFMKYISEEDRPEPLRYSKINTSVMDDKLKELLLSGRFDSAIKRFREGNVIYRGMPTYTGNGDIIGYHFLNKETRKPRTSANTSNQYTLFIDSSPLWKEYPKRSMSVICTSDIRKARNYGNVYIIFPENGSKIGICPADDIFNSFSNTMDHRLYLGLLNDIMTCAGLNDGIGFQSKLDTPANFKPGLDSMKQDSHDRDFVQPVEIMADEFKGKTWREVLTYILNPVPNNFKLTTIEGFKSPYLGKEIWTDGSCLAISGDGEPEIWQFIKGLEV